jgi:hypothetical protein
VFTLALEFGTTVDDMLEAMSAQELMAWMAFLAVRQERLEQARRDAAEGLDDETHDWTGGDE